MIPSSDYNLPRQFPSNIAVSELITKSPHLLKTNCAYFLSLVLKNNDIDLLDFLLSHEDSLQQKGLKEFIFQSVELGKIKIINHLLMKNINPNLQNDNGETLLHIAASKGDIDIVKSLLFYRANCSLLSKDNISAYDYALDQGSKKVIDLLNENNSQSMIIKGSLQEKYELNTDSPCNNYRIKQYKYSTPHSERERIGNDALKKCYDSIETLIDQSKPYAIIHSVKNDICEDEGNKCDICDKSQIHINDVKQFYSTKRTKKNEDLINHKNIYLRNDYNTDQCHYNNNDNNDNERDNNTINKLCIYFNNSNDYSLGNNNHINNNIFIKEDEDIVQQQLPSKKLKYCNSNNNERHNKLEQNNKSNYKPLQTVPKEIDYNSNLINPDEFQYQYHSQRIQEADIEPHCNGTDNKLIFTNKKEEVFVFLNEINLNEYTQLMIDNGFDDIELIIEQTKLSISITDENLRDAGIRLPGDRAKILIRFEEKAKLFDFTFNKEDMYYKMDKINKSKNDRHIQTLFRFLSTIKLEHYLSNFISSGYHSPELILIQMISRQPITEYTLEYEIKIDKIGYRARMLNKFREEAKSYVCKIKNCNVLIESQNSPSDFCNGCLIV